MEVTKEYLLLKISQFEQATIRFHEDSIANKGAAEGLRNILKELEELEKQESLKVEDLLKEVKVVKTNDNISNE
jgi:hypothetical protein